MLKKNVGNPDRAFRIILGIGLISLVFVGPRTAWGWVGVIPLLTAFVGTCPLYSLFGVNTCPKK
ncbi:MAG: DUF2892 domain-containing protein [Sphingomonadaceae bacterium]|jgi:hypothetical protein